MSAERPWEAGPFSKWVIEELNNRVNSLSFGINQTRSANNGMEYVSGPRRHWIRVFSNGVNKKAGEDSEDKWGLILKSPDRSPDIFSSRYGISPANQIYGYNNCNEPKYIRENRYRINVPEPGIVSFTVDVQKNFFATAKINWVCHSIDQLNAITPYFLTPLTTVFVEWGWNNFDLQSLINYRSVDNLKEIVNNHFKHYVNKVPPSKGNYDFIVGDITNFEYGYEDNIIKGFTEIKSRQMLYSGYNIRGEKLVNTDGAESPALGFRTVYEQVLNSLKYYTDNQTNKPSSNDPKGSNDEVEILKKMLPSKKYGNELENLSGYIYKYVTKEKTSVSATQGGNNQNFSLSDIYITLELFVDIMNSLKNKNDENSFLKNYYEVDVINTKAGYHKNLISTTRNVLIPNPNAPKFNGKGSLPYGQYKDENTTFVGDQIFRSESIPVPFSLPTRKGQFLDNKSMKKEEISSNINLNNYKTKKPDPNIQLKLLVQYNSDVVYRNDLDFVLNRYDRFAPQTQTRTTTAFNEEGLLKNVYINLEFIRESIVVDKDMIDMKSVYDKILTELNESVCDFWGLELVNVERAVVNENPNANISNTSGSRLQITDMKFSPLNVNNLLVHEIFTFDYGNNKSIIKKINFTTSLTNAMANQILYRSFGETSLSSNNLLDFSHGDMYVDKIKGSYRNAALRPPPSQTLLTFLDIIKKYLTFDPSDPNANFLMRVQVFLTTITDKKRPGVRIPSSFFIFPEELVAGLFNFRTETLGPPKPEEFTQWNIVDLCIPDKEALVYLLNDNDKKNNTNVYCAPIRNVEIEISLMGIAGIQVFQYFKIRNLPPPFTDDVVVFQVRDVNHTVDENGWETRIKASLRPAYNLSSTLFEGDVIINPTVQNLA
jgi:hypothetical protein